MPERFKVVCIPCKALYKCSALYVKALVFFVSVLSVGLPKTRNEPTTVHRDTAAGNVSVLVSEHVISSDHS